MAFFGWCLTGHHLQCRGSIPKGSSPDPIFYRCSCTCHNNDTQHSESEES